MSGAERRKYPRFDIELDMKNYGKNSCGEMPMRTTDISAKGIGCVSERPVPVGSLLDLWLHLPNGEPVHSEGTVVWVCREGYQYKMGIDLTREELKPIPIVLRALQMKQRAYLS